MTLISNVARRAHQRLWLVSGLALVAIASAVVWASWPVEHPVRPPLAGPLPLAATTTARIDSALWDVRLWQPFTDAPVVTEAPAPPLKLYSILKRGGVYIAALSAGDQAPLVYARTGDVVQGVTIRKVDATGVDVRSPVGDQRLELRP